MPDDMTALSAKLDGILQRLDALEKLVKPEAGKGTAAMSAVEDLRTQFAALSAEAGKARKAALIDQAKREGKVVQLSEGAIASLSEEHLTDHLKQLKPGRVPMRAVTPDGGGQAALSADALLAQYDGIADSAEKAAFFSAHRAEMGL